MFNEKDVLREIGARIKEVRKNSGITQESLAEKMDVSIQMISNLELGKKAIRPENLIKLCKALDTSADYILTGRRSECEITALAKKISSLPPEKQQIIEMMIDSLLH